MRNPPIAQFAAAAVALSAVLAGLADDHPPGVTGTGNDPKRPAAPPVRPVTDTYYGTDITDNYRYMEEPGNPVFDNWIRAEGRYAAAVLGSRPGHEAGERRFSEFTGGFGLVSGYGKAGDNAFYQERAPGSDTFDLMMRGTDGTSRKLVDVEALSAANGGTPMAINYFSPSPDGRRVAVGISEAGSELADLWIYDVKTGERLPNPLPRVQIGFVSWMADGSRIYVNQLAEIPEGGNPMARYLNSSAVSWDFEGTPEVLIGPGAGSSISPLPAQFPFVGRGPGTDFWSAAVVNGTQSELEHWNAPVGELPSARTAWQRQFTFEDGIVGFATIGTDYYLISNKDAPWRQLLRVERGAPMESARVLMPMREGVLIEAVSTAQDGVYVTVRDGLYSGLFRIKYDDDVEKIELPFSGSISTSRPISGIADPREPGVRILMESWNQPDQVLSYDPATGQFTDLDLVTVPDDFDPKTIELMELSATSHDGMQVPLSLMRAAGRVGPQPLIISAYGHYGSSRFPFFSTTLVGLLREGIDYGTCHVRGGGEFGEDWHRAGTHENKPNTWLDLIACAESAIGAGLTTPDLLFIRGVSAGGVAVGRAATERPDLFAGVFNEVPLAGPLRGEFTPNGPSNIPSFGSVKTEAGFRNLLAMDTYQHIEDGVAYPPMLITTGLNDPRVESWQPAKLAARMLAANPESTVLLRVEEQGGHGQGNTKAQTDGLYGDIISFVKWHAGLETPRVD